MVSEAVAEAFGADKGVQYGVPWKWAAVFGGRDGGVVVAGREGHAGGRVWCGGTWFS